MLAETKSGEAKLLDGQALSEQIKSEVKAEVIWLSESHNVVPCLAAVRVGDDPASASYVASKIRSSEVVGLRSEHHALRESTSTDELLELVGKLNDRDDVDGILIQLPLPRAIDQTWIIDSIDPAKDVDGFHPVNVGKLVLGRKVLVPCTPAGIVEMLQRYGIAIEGARACIVGRSNIVGRPLAQLLLQRDATVTVCHSRTRDLSDITRQADILVAAMGRAAFIRKEHIKPGATVIDVGINKITDPEKAVELFGEQAESRIAAIQKRGYTLTGDVHPAEAREVAGYLTPVPGGVGPLTVAMLVRNTALAAKWRRGL